MNNSSAICNLSLSTDARDKLVAILSSGGFAGVLSCSMALFLLIFFKMYKTFSERLVLYLLLSGLFVASVTALMITGIPFDFSQHHSLCQAIAFFWQYSIWILLLLTTFIVFHLAALVFFFKTLKKLEVSLVIFSLLFPLLFSWVPFLHDTYGLAGAWCWIRVYGYADCQFYREGLIEQYALWYGPLFLLLIVNAILTIAVLVVLCRRAFRKQLLYILKKISRKRAIEQDSTPANPPLLRMATSLSRASVDRLKLQIAEELFILLAVSLHSSEIRMQR